MKKYSLLLSLFLLSIPMVVLAQTVTFDQVSTNVTVSGSGTCTVTLYLDARQLVDGSPSDQALVVQPVLNGGPGGSTGLVPDPDGTFSVSKTNSGAACSGTWAWHHDSYTGTQIASGSYPLPTPTPAPTPTPENPLYGFYSSGGVLDGPPTPFDLPEPDPNGRLAIQSLWEAQSLYDAVRAFLTIFSLARQNEFIQVIFILGFFVIALYWAVSTVRNRETNV